MITSARNPTSMPPEDRFREVAFLLASGYLRFLAQRQKALEVAGKPEALCAAVDGKETVAGKETR